ncbi:hypothetical protein QTG56_22660 (plasmid) [Rossellomorea sp. AcN35-11]|nr:hypothetical protein [Rossellomorea aquimaris]WJV32176.1 hypothetical protein QTG56_22660 [Rossellomorea sp. AcN35-11]
MESAVKTMDKVKRQNQRDKVLELLRTAGENGVPNTRFKEVSIRWDARVRELYQEGYKIKVEPMNEKGVFLYTLLEEPAKKLGKPKHALDVLIAEINKQHKGVITSEDLAELVRKKRLNVVRAFGYHKRA